MNYHSTLSTRTLMKLLGLGGIRRRSGGTGTVDPTFMGACALALFTLTGQHFFASFAESEPRVAWIGALLMGVPSLILAGLTFWLILIT
jgi:hypothetical protein